MGTITGSSTISLLIYCLLGPNFNLWWHLELFRSFNSNPWSSKYWFIHSFPAKLTGAPKSSIITCFPFSVKFTNISSFTSNSSHQFTFNSLAVFLIFSQFSHLHPIQFVYCLLLFFEPLLFSLVLPLSVLLLSLLSGDVLLFLDMDLMFLEKLLCLSLTSSMHLPSPSMHLPFSSMLL